MAHAEAACSQELVDRIARWIDDATRDLTAASASGPDGTAVTAAPQASTPDAAA
jgi:hypothetical protein